VEAAEGQPWQRGRIRDEEDMGVEFKCGHLWFPFLIFDCRLLIDRPNQQSEIHNQQFAVNGVHC
jgi:hypothetical protein